MSILPSQRGQPAIRFTTAAISGDRVVIVSSNGAVKLWDISNNQFKLTDTIQEKHIPSNVAIIGNKVVTVSGSTRKLWDISDDQFKLVATSLGGGLTAWPVAISDNKVVIGSSNGMKLWDIHNDQFKPIDITHEESYGWNRGFRASSVAIDGDKVVTASEVDMKLWDISDNQLKLIAITPEKAYGGHVATIRSVAISGDKVISADAYETLKLWSLSPNLKGTPQDNPLLWIEQEVTMPQLDLINRAYEATIAGKEFTIDPQSEDAKVMLSFPNQVKQLLLQRLYITE